MPVLASRSVDIKAAAAHLYDALVSESGLAGWWTNRVEAESHEGGAITFTFMPVFNPQMRITSLVEHERVEWRCIGGHEPWQDNVFRFEIDARGDRCVVFFRHEYAEELSDEEYGRYNFNWGYYLNSLKRFCETGRGTPANPTER